MAAKQVDTPIVAYKGFDKNLKCRGFQYEIGMTYHHEGAVVRCAAGGFHACLSPIDVLSYYNPADSRFCLVEVSGLVATDSDNTKVAAGTIRVVRELTLQEMCAASVAYAAASGDHKSNTGDLSTASNTGVCSTASNTGNYSTASNTDDYSAASNTGYQSAASNTGNFSTASNTGGRSAASNTGNYSTASNTGDFSAASNTGACSAASNTGYQSAASNTGDFSAASNTGDFSAASNTGRYSTASNTGYQSTASNTGDFSAASNMGNDSTASVEGVASVAMASGTQGMAKAARGSAIVLCHRADDGALMHIKAGIAGCDVKPDTWYVLSAEGEFEEWAE